MENDIKEIELRVIFLFFYKFIYSIRLYTLLHPIYWREYFYIISKSSESQEIESKFTLT